MNDSESGWVQLGDDINTEFETSVSLSGDDNKVSIGSQFLMTMGMILAT